MPWSNASGACLACPDDWVLELFFTWNVGSGWSPRLMVLSLWEIASMVRRPEDDFLINTGSAEASC
jgi:hypothetical protein